MTFTKVSYDFSKEIITFKHQTFSTIKPYNLVTANGVPGFITHIVEGGRIKF